MHEQIEHKYGPCHVRALQDRCHWLLPRVKQGRQPPDLFAKIHVLILQESRLLGAIWTETDIARTDQLSSSDTRENMCFMRGMMRPRAR